MSNAYITDIAHKRIFEIWSGEIMKEEVREHALRHVSDPNLPQCPHVLVDVRNARFEAAIDAEFLGELCNLYREHSEIWRNAKVAVIPGINFQLAVLYGHLAGARGVRSIAFNDPHVACLWLGIPDSDAKEGLTQARAAMVKEWGEDIISSHDGPSDTHQKAVVS
ncbi:hypothetical protein AYO43_03545 [Nitrospira sp. SCGC AG-212-E16]|nr:hypothetical protein AYO43_03545 [Nitrospira sp. SCGC AG-212-E16]